MEKNLTNNILDNLDYTNRTVEYRLNILNNICKKNENELIEYFDNMNVNLTQKDNLSNYNKVSKALERAADYLLYSNYKKETDNIQYKIYLDFLLL